ncbi:hypothetical protein M9Y10_000366 [Tritrichomonas musculus]|uniref:DUF3447 domain-containing protein n=1 Tax=Tritrichomonas musculus TaxID=1915356 RepID=A0ABR2L4Y7_9EUKA
MEIQQYIDKIKSIQDKLMEFIDNSDNESESFDNFKHLLESKNIISDKHDLKLFLYLLSSITNNYKRGPNFFQKIESILSFYKNQIQSYFTNSEIYQIFKMNNRNLLSLINVGILNLSDVNDNEYFTSENKEKCEKGENDLLLCELIRNDSVEQFIQYVNQTIYPLSSRIDESIYETNTFLYNKCPTVIEYSAFFGSIKIFNYLKMNNVQLTPSLWIYAIHSNNPDLIHILEQSKIVPEDKTYKKCLEEAIKCHHNAIANYIYDNLLKNQDENFCLSKAVKYYNFEFISNNKNQLIFKNVCKYDYFNLVQLLLQKMDFDVNQYYIKILRYFGFLMKF